MKCWPKHKRSRNPTKRLSEVGDRLPKGKKTYLHCRSFRPWEECGVKIHHGLASRRFRGREEAREGRASGGAESCEAQEKAHGASHSEANHAVCDSAGSSDGRPIRLPGPLKTTSRTGTAAIQGPRVVLCLQRDGAYTRTVPKVGQWYFSGPQEVVSFLRCT